MRIISWPNTDPAHLLSTLSPDRYRSGPKTRYEASGAELPRWSFHPLEIMSFSCRTQTKFHTARWRFPTWRSTVFAHESSTRSARFDAENRLYCFALTVPLGEPVDELGRMSKPAAVDLRRNALHELAVKVAARRRHLPKHAWATGNHDRAGRGRGQHQLPRHFVVLVRELLGDAAAPG